MSDEFERLGLPEPSDHADLYEEWYGKYDEPGVTHDALTDAAIQAEHAASKLGSMYVTLDALADDPEGMPTSAVESYRDLQQRMQELQGWHEQLATEFRERKRKYSLVEDDDG